MTESFKVLCQCCEQSSSDKKKSTTDHIHKGNTYSRSFVQLAPVSDTHIHTYICTLLVVILCFSFPTFCYDLFLFSLTVYIVSLCVWLVFGPLQWMIQRKLKTQLAISLSGKQNSGMEHRLLHFYQQVSTHRGFCFCVSCLLCFGFSIFSTC